MKSYKKILNKNDLVASKYTIKGKAIIVDTNIGRFVLKENKGNNIYKYLISRNFLYFPKIIDSDDNYNLIEYEEDIDYDKEQKAYDIIRLIALLHSKTTYYKEIDFDEYKTIYEKIENDIIYIKNYYIDIINIIESKIYMSPSEYLISRNISKIFSCIYFCENELNNFKKIINDKKRKRVVTLHNNLKLDNVIKNKNIYLISWDKSKIDSPIYDILKFYDLYALDFDFSSLLDEYEKIFPLNEEEKLLFSILISIPKKIDMDKCEYDKVKYIRKLLDKIYKTEKLLTSKKEETTSTKK